MGKLLTKWDPEDATFWQTEGHKVATRNQWISIPALLLAFCVWQLWSIIAVYLPQIGFPYTANEISWLIALPALSGATFRIPYTFMVPIVGGRRWVFLSTLLLLIPLIGVGICLQDTATPFSTMAIFALLCGFGGANFSSSLANIGYFYPKSQKGKATGLNGGLGNLGVSVVQFTIPFVITAGLFGALGGEPQSLNKGETSSLIWLQNAAFIWIPFIVIVLCFIWFGMNDIASAKASFKDQLIIFKRKHNWLMSWLYLGTFGSFIGFSAALPLLIKTQFPHINGVQFAFLGPLLGSIFRVIGGSISDKFRASHITQWCFIMMLVSVLGILFFLPGNGSEGNFIGFLLSFLVLFVFVGLGNGSTFAQVPTIFRQYHTRKSDGSNQESLKQAIYNANKESGAVTGFIAAIGAYGGFIIPRINSLSLQHFGKIDYAFIGLMVFYVTCVVINWWYYSRKNAETPC